MKDSELIGKVHSSVYHQCQKRGYAAPVDVLMDVGVLDKKKYEDWRFGRIPDLEAVCTCNLRQLSFIMAQIRAYAKKADYKSSFCYYKQWGMKKKNGQGHKPVRPLRFSKSGNPDIEKAYAMHYVDLKTIERLKAEAFTESSGLFSHSCLVKRLFVWYHGVIRREPFFPRRKTEATRLLQRW